MLTSLRTLCIGLAVTLAAAGAASAAEGTYSYSSTRYATNTSSSSAIFNPDVVYDYEVWASYYELNWYVVATYENGHVSEYKHSSHVDANDFAAWLWFHIVEIEDVDVVSRWELSEPEFVQRFDKRADAVDLAELFEDFGLAAEIRRVSILRYSLPTSR
ncbi:MAG: hypothetical protein WDZ59_10185 [Pirellulales bacterium]